MSLRHHGAFQWVLSQIQFKDMVEQKGSFQINEVIKKIDPFLGGKYSHTNTLNHTWCTNFYRVSYPRSIHICNLPHFFGTTKIGDRQLASSTSRINQTGMKLSNSFVNFVYVGFVRQQHWYEGDMVRSSSIFFMENFGGTSLRSLCDHGEHL